MGLKSCSCILIVSEVSLPSSAACCFSMLLARFAGMLFTLMLAIVAVEGLWGKVLVRFCFRFDLVFYENVRMIWCCMTFLCSQSLRYWSTKRKDSLSLVVSKLIEWWERVATGIGFIRTRRYPIDLVLHYAAIFAGEQKASFSKDVQWTSWWWINIRLCLDGHSVCTKWLLNRFSYSFRTLKKPLDKARIKPMTFSSFVNI